LNARRITSFVAGGMAGGALTLLLSPKSGREFRNSVAFRLGELQERGNEEYFEVRERMAESVQNLSPRGRGRGSEEVSSRTSELRERMLGVRSKLDGDSRE